MRRGILLALIAPSLAAAPSWAMKIERMPGVTAVTLANAGPLLKLVG